MSEEKKIEISVKKEKVAIVGFAGTRDQAPYDNPEYEIWTVNNLHKFVPRQDRVFQLHQRWEWDLEGQCDQNAHNVHLSEHVEFMRTCGLPVYTVEKFDDIPTSIRYPIEVMTEEFGVQRTGHENPDHKDGYWTNSISMMMALAIYEGFKTIEVYGVDMAVGTEYNEQRPSCEYYLGIAKGRGIEVKLPASSDLLKTRFVYGFETEKVEAWKQKVQKTLNEMHKRKHDSDNIIRQQQSVSDKYEGAITAIREMDSRWS